MTGLMIAAPQSGAGKTTVTLALLRALARQGVVVRSAKAGPDYIDPAFHAAASGSACVNLDPWAMRPELVAGLAAETGNASAFVVEATMGLFDGAADGSGSAAELAVSLGLNIALVVDCAKQSHSVAALVRGFATHRPDVALAGLILNRVGSARHAALLREALAPLAIPVFGVLPRAAELALPERHLGLVQAGEHEALAAFLERAADWVAAGCDLNALAALAAPSASRGGSVADSLAPLGQHIAIARDAAFAFAYPHLLDGWRRAGAMLDFFSPLADEAPAADADAIYLPGGYPELHAGKLAAAGAFRQGMRAAAARGTRIYGECGGYMVLGAGLTDGEGACHAMLDLLPLETSFATRRLHLGYRRLQATDDFVWPGRLRGHEFHYATIVSEGPGEALFTAEDARGDDLGAFGRWKGSVCGSFLHVIDREA
ncbi:cobyrinate a,c-diamide synthase [Aurantimonas endophytica]|uniref:Hydrogenobyrinate a,c-diamide synthase n=1 Tax=Aurantimonas endophytica TaxID=1522175 RepID=A0A7W6MP52_9HYPH|nr:cobyrinic acid a,c-diamide synthase [Aurantimonas endophytica]MCO6403403.1 cobyrinate a,c-diamide synthase [Aurantimonas endophytica]